MGEIRYDETEVAGPSRMITGHPQRTDQELIANCLQGDQEAWRDLIGKYKQLVYSIPLRYRIQPQDSADIFQSVWADVFRELGNLRQTESFSGWLITATSRKCLHWLRKQSKSVHLSDGQDATVADSRELFPDHSIELEREQILREAILKLPERCQEMVQLLFFQQPPISYRDLAERLGLAEGSIGFIRGRCLEKLRRALEELGF